MDKQTKIGLGFKFAEYFQSPLLDDIYETRTNGISGILLKEFNNEEGEWYNIQNEMKEVISKISDKKICEILLEKLERMEDSFLNEENYLIKEYYKFGLTDNLQLALETGYRSSILKRTKEKITILKIKFQMLLKNYQFKKFLKNHWKDKK